MRKRGFRSRKRITKSSRRRRRIKSYGVSRGGIRL
nr:MAG TPA: hypothetical protein [Microviridae sp.]